MLISFFRGISRYFELETQFVDRRKYIVFLQHAFTHGFNDTISQLEVFWRGRIIVDKEVFENKWLLHLLGQITVKTRTQLAPGRQFMRCSKAGPKSCNSSFY